MNEVEHGKPNIFEHASVDDVHDARFREGWDCALAAVALDAAQTSSLPSTLASVDDVRRVCEAAGLGGYMRSGVGISTWGVGTTLIVRFVSVSAGQFRVEVERSADERVATLYPDSLATLLWHAITAARSAS